MSLHKLVDVETVGQQKKIAEDLKGHKQFSVAERKPHAHTNTPRTPFHPIGTLRALCVVNRAALKAGRVSHN